MHIAAAPTITLLIAAVMGLLNLWLSARVARVRGASKIMMGHGEVPELVARGRAHANFNEYVPIALILMLLIELNVGVSPWLWVAGVVLVIARVVHAFGMDRAAPNRMRLAGILLTWGVTAALVVWAVLLSYRA
jgi:uncharacterized protein